MNKTISSSVLLVLLSIALLFIIIQVSSSEVDDDAFGIICFDGEITDVMIIRDSLDCTVKYEMTDGILWVYLLPR